MFGLREIFPKLRLGDVEELDGCDDGFRPDESFAR
jgi:hypothetical protein